MVPLCFSSGTSHLGFFENGSFTGLETVGFIRLASQEIVRIFPLSTSVGT